MTQYSVVFVTVPDAKTADRISQALVEQKLAACVNRLPGIQSRYRWEGKIETAEEFLLIVKTRTSLTAEVAQAVRGLHPYSVPEIIALPIADGYAPYLTWIGASTLFTPGEAPPTR